jgi:hypothetical protein
VRKAICTALAVATGAAAVALGSGSAGAENPPFDPGNFVKGVDNPWFPLKPGTTLRYRGQKDGKPGIDVFKVTSRTKTVMGVEAVVVHDQVILDRGGLSEDTLDYYAQDRQGNVWYLGEATKELDRGRVVSREGSWQAGVKGAEAGIFMPGHPRVGQTFRQEYYKGHAEDHVQVVTIRGNRMKTKEWTPLEPGVRDRKIYQRGVGTVLEETVKGGQERWAVASVSRP